MRNNNYAPYCVICQTRNHEAGCGVDFENGIHICMDCATGISSAVIRYFAEHKEIYHAYHENIDEDEVTFDD